MQIYVAVALVLLLASAAFSTHRQLITIGRWFSYSAVLGVSLLAAFRKAGTDYEIYNAHFQGMLESPEGLYEANAGWWERGFVTLAGAFTSAGLPYVVFMTFSVILSLAICSYVARKTVTNPTAFLFALFALSFMFVPFVRQDLAAALVFLAAYWATHKRFGMFAVASLLAVSIHLSAVFMVLVVLVAAKAHDGRLKQLLFSKGLLISLVLVAMLAYLFADPARLEMQLAVYGAEDFVQGVVDERLSAIRNASKFVFYILVALMARRVCVSAQQDALFKLGWRVVILVSVICIVSLQITPVFSRFATYLFPFIAHLYACMLRQRGRRHLGAITLCSLLLFAHFFAALVPLAEWM